MPAYRCCFLDRTGNPVMTRVASENEAEAVRMARNLSAICGAREFELWLGERCLRTEKADPADAGYTQEEFRFRV